MTVWDKISIPSSNIEMLRRKSLSLDKSPVERPEKNERRSSVAAGLLGYHERSPIHYHHNVEKLHKTQRSGSFSGSSPEIKERRGSIVQRYAWLDFCRETGFSFFSFKRENKLMVFFFCFSPKSSCPLFSKQKFSFFFSLWFINFASERGKWERNFLGEVLPQLKR